MEPWVLEIRLASYRSAAVAVSPNMKPERQEQVIEHRVEPLGLMTEWRKDPGVFRGDKEGHSGAAASAPGAYRGAEVQGWLGRAWALERIYPHRFARSRGQAIMRFNRSNSSTAHLSLCICPDDLARPNCAFRMRRGVPRRLKAKLKSRNHENSRACGTHRLRQAIH